MRIPHFLLALLATTLALAPATHAAPDEEPEVRVEDEAPKPMKRAEMLDRIAAHVVVVRIRFQKDLEAEATGVNPPDARGTNERYRLWRMSYALPGFVFRDRKTVIVSDIFLPRGAIESIHIEAPGAEPVPARLRGFLRHAEAAILGTEAELASEPVGFADMETDIDPLGLMSGAVSESATGFDLWLTSLSGTARRSWTGGDIQPGGPKRHTEGMDGGTGTRRTLDLILDKAGRSLGFRFGYSLDSARANWRGPSLLNDDEIPFERLDELATGIAQGSGIHRLKVMYRTRSRHDRGRSPFDMGDEAEGEAEAWGFALTPEVLLVVGRLEEEAIRKIESIHLDDFDDGTGAPGAFLGRVKGLDAWLVRIEGAAFEPMFAATGEVPEVGEAILVHRKSWRAGARRDEVALNRVLGWHRGWNDESFLSVEREVAAGELLLDTDGLPVGFAARLDPEDREVALQGRRRNWREEPPLVGVLFAEQGPAAGFLDRIDDSVMPVEETEGSGGSASKTGAPS